MRGGVGSPRETISGAVGPGPRTTPAPGCRPPQRSACTWAAHPRPGTGSRRVGRCRAWRRGLGARHGSRGLGTNRRWMRAWSSSRAGPRRRRAARACRSCCRRGDTCTRRRPRTAAAGCRCPPARSRVRGSRASRACRRHQERQATQCTLPGQEPQAARRSGGCCRRQDDRRERWCCGLQGRRRSPVCSRAPPHAGRSPGGPAGRCR